jgi:hypothetical protein
MSKKDRTPGQAEEPSDSSRGLSRRRMLGVTGAGAAGLAASAFAVGTPAMAATKPDTREQGREAEAQGPDQVPADEPVIVHVADAHTGEVDVYHGTSHTKLHDPALAAKLRRSAR